MTTAPLLTDEDVQGMRADAAAMMHDECQIAPVNEVQDGAGEMISNPDPAWGNPIACAFDVHPGSKAFGTEHTLLVYDAGIRLPIGTIVDQKDLIKITKRFGQDVDAGPTYEIMGPAQDSASAVRYLLRRVQT